VIYKNKWLFFGTSLLKPSLEIRSQGESNPGPVRCYLGILPLQQRPFRYFCFLNNSFPSFALQYIHIIRGEELYRLARDYTRYLVTGKRTARLKRAMLNWRDFSESITKKDSTQEDLFGRPTDSEFTWWQQPQKFIHRLGELCRGYLRPHTQES
jgi:hypothetical protein